MAREFATHAHRDPRAGKPTERGQLIAFIRGSPDRPAKRLMRVVRPQGLCRRSKNSPRTPLQSESNPGLQQRKEPPMNRRSSFSAFAPLATESRGGTATSWSRFPNNRPAVMSQQRSGANHESVLTAPAHIDVLPLDPSGEPLESQEADVVAVYNYRRGKSRAVCSCGWTGHSRHLKSTAVLDALLHAAQTGCDPSAPLVLEPRIFGITR